MALIGRLYGIFCLDRFAILALLPLSAVIIAFKHYFTDLALIGWPLLPFFAFMGCDFFTFKLAFVGSFHELFI